MEDIKNTKDLTAQRKGCVVVNVPQTEETWECLSGSSLLPTDILFVQGEIPFDQDQENEAPYSRTELVTEVSFDGLDKDATETGSEKRVESSDVIIAEKAGDEGEGVKHVGSMDTGGETPISDILRKTPSKLPTTKLLPSLAKLVAKKESLPVSDYKLRFGFEDRELVDFINEVYSTEDSKHILETKMEEGNGHFHLTKIDSSGSQYKSEIEFCNMKGEYQDEVENEKAESEAEQIPNENLEPEAEEEVVELEDALPDTWINFKNKILDKYGVNVTIVNYETDKLPLFQQKINNLIDGKEDRLAPNYLFKENLNFLGRKFKLRHCKFKPKARRFKTYDKEILQVTDKHQKKNILGEGDDEAEEEEEIVEEEELVDKETDDEEDVEEEGEEEEYEDVKPPPEVNEILEINRNYGDTYPYCPVLFKKGIYREGLRKFAAVYLNQVYILSSREALDEFLQKPETYAHFTSPPEIPPPRICVVGTIGCNGSSLCKSLAQLLGACYISLYGQVNSHIMPADFLPIGLLYESPRCIKEVPITEKPTEATEAEVDSVNKIRRYLNYCGPLPDYLLERYMILPFWEQRPYASEGLCYYRFPHTARDMRRMIQMRCLPDVIIHVQSDSNNVKKLAKKVTNKWKINQGVLKKMLIEKDKIEKRMFWKKRKMMFRKLLLDFLENESEKLNVYRNVISEENINQPETLTLKDSKKQPEGEITGNEPELPVSETEDGKTNTKVTDGNLEQENKFKMSEGENNRYKEDEIFEKLSTPEARDEGIKADGEASVSVTNRESDIDTLAENVTAELTDSTTSSREVLNVIKGVIDDILRKPSWIFSRQFYDYLERTGLRPRPGFNPKRHSKTQRRIILRYILQIPEIETKLFPKINRILREQQGRLKLIANKIKYFDNVPDPYVYLMAAFRKETQQITQIKKLARDNKIPWIIHKPKDEVDKIYSYLSDVIRERTAYLLKTDILTVEMAEKLLQSGFLTLSKFGRWCPVQLAEGKNPVQMYFLAERSPEKIYPVVFRKYVYFLSSKEAKIKFCINPLKYMHSDVYASVIPLRCAVIGPPKAGKTEFANRLAKEFGVEVVSIGSALRYVTEETPWTDLAKTILTYLKSGRIVPDTLGIRAVEAAIISPKSASQGWVLDGCPDNVAQLMKLYDLNIVPMKIILLDRTFGECLCNSESIFYPQTSLRRKPVYSMKLLEEKYSIWMTAGERCRLVKSIRELWGNLHIHPENMTAYFVYQTAKPHLLQALAVHRKYIDRIMNETTVELKEMCVTSLEFAEHQHPDFRSYCPVCWTKYALTRFPNKIPFSKVRTCLIQYKNYFYWLCRCHYSLFLNSPDKYLYAGGPKFKRVFERRYLDPLLAPTCEALTAGGNCIVCYCLGWPKQILHKGKKEYIVGHLNTMYAFCSESCLDEFMLRSEFYSSVEVKNNANIVKDYTRLTPEILSLHPLGFLHQYVADAVYSVIKALIADLPFYPGLSAEQAALIYIGYHLKCEALSNSEERECYEKSYSEYKERMKTLKRFMRVLTGAQNPFHPDTNLTDEDKIVEFKKQIVKSALAKRTESVHCKIHGQKLYTLEQLPAVVDKYSTINERNMKEVTRVVDKCLRSLFTYAN